MSVTKEGKSIERSSGSTLDTKADGILNSQPRQDEAMVSVNFSSAALHSALTVLVPLFAGLRNGKLKSKDGSRRVWGW